MRRRASLAAGILVALGVPAPAAALTGADLERLAASSVAGHAPAPAGYADPAGDSGLGPDLTTVTVGNDAGGTIAVRLEVPNVPTLRVGHFFALFLDTDRRAATGSPTALGADYAVAFDGLTGDADLARWTGGAWDFGVASTSLRTAWAGGASVSVHRNELGGTSAFDFWAGATWTSEKGARYGDVAPDAGTWTYTLAELDGDAAGGPVLDGSPPRVRALASGGRTSHPVRLRYRVSDESGETRERIRILRGGRVVAVLATRYAAGARGGAVSVPWPARRPGRYRFCVEAWDRAGNGSPSSCARVLVRRG